MDLKNLIYKNLLNHEDDKDKAGGPMSNYVKKSGIHKELVQ